MDKSTKTKKVVKDVYTQIAKVSASCCGSCSCNQGKQFHAMGKILGYNDDQLQSVPDGANLGLGCGNPTALGELKKGQTVLDLGSGAGFDAFLAANRVGDKGKVIGVDMTPEMISKAQANAIKGNYKNVEFKLGDIENIPLNDATVDVIISNCVINLAPDKGKVFSEAFRVLKPSGLFYLSDIVLTAELSTKQRNDMILVASCVGGALLKDQYIKLITQAGFTIKSQKERRDISKQQYQSMPVMSLQLVAVKSSSTPATSN